MKYDVNKLVIFKVHQELTGLSGWQEKPKKFRIFQRAWLNHYSRNFKAFRIVDHSTQSFKDRRDPVLIQRKICPWWLIRQVAEGQFLQLVLFEEINLISRGKYCQLLTHPCKHTVTGTVANLLLEKCPNKPSTIPGAVQCHWCLLLANNGIGACYWTWSQQRMALGTPALPLTFCFLHLGFDPSCGRGDQSMSRRC